MMDIKNIENELEIFARERDWNQFHTPKNLAMALSVEASELLELYQWLKPDEDADQERIEEEVADVAIYLIRFCTIAGIDLNSAISKKIQKNSKKYPSNT